MYEIKKIKEMMEMSHYFPNDEIVNALFVSLNTGKPLLIEGDPGVGKTAIAKAIADSLGLELVRVQMYDGLTDDKLLYDYNYQKQLLTLEAIKPILSKELNGKNNKEAITYVSDNFNFYGKDFLIERPVLRAINGCGKKVLLFDELDKAPEEEEYMLLEFLENYSISIPEYGTVKCPEGQEPIVFITSNKYRELSKAMKRRCAYLYIHPKTLKEYVDIILSRVKIEPRFAEGIAKCLVKAGNSDMKQKPSVAEGIEWAEFLSKNGNFDTDFIISTLGLLIKDNKDMDVMKKIVNEESKLWK